MSPEAMGKVRGFPILNAPKGCTKFIRWDALDEKHAMRIHDQTLERLAQRGGLSPMEVWINVHKLKLPYTPPTTQENAVALCNSLAPKEAEHG